ncbi:MAG: hypothetical protein WCL51_05815 [Bacteroidota bacterium]
MRKKITVLVMSSIFTALLISCSSNDDKTKEVSKDGSVETIMTVDHLNDSLDLIHTTYNVWVKYALVNKFVHTDTIPALGTTVEKDDDGNVTGLPYKKDYELFITVK